MKREERTPAQALITKCNWDTKEEAAFSEISDSVFAQKENCKGGDKRAAENNQ